MEIIDAVKDKAGRVFDSVRFRANPDGTPFLNKFGYFMPRGGRPRKNPQPAEIPPAETPSLDDIEAASMETPPEPEPLPEPQPEPVDDTPEMTTAETIIGIIQTALVLIGEDEGILTDSEKTLIRRPLERVLHKYNIGDDVLPPEVDLAVALAVVVIARLKKPKTASFAARVRAWIARKWFNRKGKRLAHKIDAATENEESNER